VAGLVLALRAYQHGHTTTAVAWSIAVFWAYPLSVVVILPATLMYAPLMLLLPVLLGVPTVSRVVMRRLVVGVVAVAFATVAAGRLARMSNLEHDLPAWLIHLVVLQYVPLSLTIIALEVWHNHVSVVARADELRRSRARVVHATDRARRNLERDLHDGAQQLLVGATVQLRAAHRMLTTDPARVASVIDSTTTALHRAIDELRNLAHGVYPAVLTDHGLVEALTTAARSCLGPITVTAEHVRRYQADVEAGVYFCCLEAIQNALKHGGDDVLIDVQLDGRDGLAFTVSDNGPGFPKRPDSNGDGLTNMQDRIGALGGTLTIDSQPPRGTTINGHINTT